MICAFCGAPGLRPLRLYTIRRTWPNDRFYPVARDPRLKKAVKKFYFFTAFLSSGAIGASRTRDPLLRRQMLYPTELQPHNMIIITTAAPGSKIRRKNCMCQQIPGETFITVSLSIHIRKQARDSRLATRGQEGCCTQRAAPPFLIPISLSSTVRKPLPDAGTGC